VTKHHDGQRGVRASSKSQARYPVAGKVDVAFLEDALRLWDARQADPDKPMWLLIQELRLVTSKNWVTEGDSQAVISDKKNILAATASRLLRKAKNLIRNAGLGKFPVSSGK
jgi:hypothetical protein